MIEIGGGQVYLESDNALALRIEHGLAVFLDEGGGEGVGGKYVEHHFGGRQGGCPSR